LANPQIENGFTRIANELYDEILKSDLSLREIKTVFCVIRYTYGFQRKCCELAVRFISKATNIKYQHIAETLKELENKNLISFIHNAKHKQGRQIQLNKDYDSWKLNSSQKSDGFKLDSIQKSDGIVPKEVTETVPKKVTKKENYKENIKHDQAPLINSSSKHKGKNWRHRKRNENEKVFISKEEIQKHFSRELNQKDFNEINNIAERFGIETMIDLFNSLSNKMHSTNIWSDESIEARAKELIYSKNVNNDKQNQITKEDLKNENYIRLVSKVITLPESETKKVNENKPIILSAFKDVFNKEIDLKKAVSKYAIGR
jgi:phage replication O-like protein O